jgi:hypothetical protein
MKVYYKHSIPPTYFGHSCGNPQGGVLQRMDTFRYYKSKVHGMHYVLPFMSMTYHIPSTYIITT